MRLARASFLTLIALFVAASALWGCMAILFCGPAGDTERLLGVVLFALVALAVLTSVVSGYARWRVIAVYSAAFVALLSWWYGLELSNDRDWQPDVARLAYAEIEGDVVTVHNVRNFAYRTERDYTPAYYDKRFELSKLTSADMVTVYWMGPAIAHVFVSFGFSDGSHLAISIETRKERGEAYSTLKGFFRQYELYYVVADERDVIRLRTNYRHDPPEDVYLYRVHGPIDNTRRVFLEYMRKINALTVQPEFYNTLTTNCTTNIWLHTLVNREHLPFSWKLLASGYAAEYAYEAGRLGTEIPFDELKRRAYVNPRAQAADSAADFSARIRELPRR